MKAVEIIRLRYTYPDGTEALKGVTLHINEGESIAIIGPNGAGKSTLLLHLNGILKGNGTVRIFGVDAKENPEKVRRFVGLVFQNPDDQLFMPTVFDDVAFGPINMGIPPDEVRRRVENSLRLVGLEGHEKKSPHHLSYGEKKRVALATVLSMSPRILALDEPLGNLDPRGRIRLMKILSSLKTTKIIATHDLEAVSKLCNRTVIIDSGRIFCNGRTKEILRNFQLLKRHGLAWQKI
jgi:cobalt/nickel transport system ATP-binding protein